jgi:hypothetical protein
VPDGPYIVTTKRGRRAVATLEEVHKTVYPMPGAGGKVTLPGGAVITVERVNWDALVDALGAWELIGYELSADEGDPEAQRRILDAYNARQEAARA